MGLWSSAVLSVPLAKNWHIRGMGRRVTSRSGREAFAIPIRYNVKMVWLMKISSKTEGAA
jgi:hypothetical protein